MCWSSSGISAPAGRRGARQRRGGRRLRGRIGGGGHQSRRSGARPGRRETSLRSQGLQTLDPRRVRRLRLSYRPRAARTVTHRGQIGARADKEEVKNGRETYVHDREGTAQDRGTRGGLARTRCRPQDGVGVPQGEAVSRSGRAAEAPGRGNHRRGNPTGLPGGDDQAAPRRFRAAPLGLDRNAGGLRRREGSPGEGGTRQGGLRKRQGHRGHQRLLAGVRAAGARRTASPEIGTSGVKVSPTLLPYDATAIKEPTNGGTRV